MSKEWRLGCEYCDQKQARAEAAEARVKELEEALRPFADAAECFKTMPIKDPTQWFAYSGTQSNSGTSKGAISVADLRRAASLTQKPGA